MNGREEGGQYYISQTCDQERFETRKVVFWWKCLNIFATACSTIYQSLLTIFAQTIMHLVSPLPPPKKKNRITIVFDFFWDDCNTQEKLEAMVMKNLGG